LKLRFDKVSEIAKTINVGIFEQKPEFVVVKILHFPWIFILWAGSIIMFTGITVGIWKRAVKARNAAE
jgi:cytochrome c biogenesis factor